MADNEVRITIVASGAAEAARVLQGVATAGGQIGSIAASGAREAERAVDSLGGTARRVFEIFTGVTLGNIFVAAAEKVRALTVEIIQLGAQARVQEEAFRLVAESVGASSQGLQAAIQRAADGLANQSDTMLASARALQQGLQPQQLVRLMEIARSQAKLAGVEVTQAFNDITQAVTTQQVRSLKQFGIVIDLNRAYEAHAQRLGTVAQALTEEGQSRALATAVIENMRDKLVTTTSEIIKQDEAVKRFRIEWQETKESVGKNAIEMAVTIVDNLRKIGEALSDNSWLQRAKDNYFAFFKWLDEQSGQRDSVKRLTEAGRVPGVPTAATGARISQAEIDALRAEGELLDQIGSAAAKAAPQIDTLKDAMFRSEQAVKQLSAAHTLGTLNALEFASALDREAAKLRALKDPTVEVTNRIRDLETQAASVRKTFQLADALANIQQQLGVALNAIAVSSATMNAAIEQGAVTADEAARRQIAAIEQTRDAQVAAIDKTIAAQRAARAEVTTITALETQRAAIIAQATAQIIVQRAKEEAATKALADMLRALAIAPHVESAEGTFTVTDEELARANALANQITVITRNFNAFGNELTRDEALLAAYEAALAALPAGFTASDAAAKELIDQIVTLRGRLIEMQGVMDPEAWKGLSAPVRTYVDDLKELAKQTQANVDIETALGDTSAALSAKIDGQRQQIEVLARVFGSLSPEVQAAVTALNELKGQAFDEDMRRIAVQAELLGPAFDAVAAAIDRTRQEMLRLADANGVLDPQVRALQDRLNNLIDFQQTRDLFRDLWSSIGNTFDEMVRGILQGTQSIGDAFKRLAENILINFINRLIQQGFNKLQDAVVSFFMGLASGAANAAGVAAGGGVSAGGGGGGGVTGFGNNFGAGSSSGMNVNITGFNPSALQTFWSGLSGIASWATSGGQMAGPAFSGVTSVDMIASGASFTEAASVAAQGMSSFAVAAGIAGAAVTVFSRAVSLFNEGFTGANIGGLVGGVAGGIAGAFGGPLAPITVPLGIILGDIIGSLLGGLFDLEGEYIPKRQEAIKDATASLEAINSLYAEAAKSGDIARVQAALGAGFGREQDRLPVRADLNLPKTLAAELGIVGPELATGLIQASFAALTPAQFKGLIAAFRRNPALVSATISGSGDVGYLPQDQAEQVAAQVKDAAVKLVQAFIAIEEVRDKIDEAGTQMRDAFATLLPEDAITLFETQSLNPFKAKFEEAVRTGLGQDVLDGILKDFQGELDKWQAVAQVWKAGEGLDTIATAFEGLLPAGLADSITQQIDDFHTAILAAIKRGDSLEAIQKQATDFEKHMQTLAAGMSLLTGIANEVANLTHDPALALDLFARTYSASLAQLNANIVKGHEALTSAIASGDIDKIIVATGQLHDAYNALAQAQLAIVKQIEEAIAGLLDTFGGPLLGVMQRVATFRLSQGDPAAVNALLQALEDVGDKAQSTALRLFSVAAGLSTIVNALPTAIKGNARGGVAGLGAVDFTGVGPEGVGVEALGGRVGKILETVTRAATPFLGQIQDFIDQAVAAGDETSALKFLQQQASAIEQLGTAAVDGVAQWRDQSIQAATDLTDTFVAGVEGARDAAAIAIDAQIAGIRNVADEQVRANEAQISALQDQIQAARAWQSVAKSVREQLSALMLGTQAPLNPADQFAIAQQQYEAAQAAFAAGPTAETAAAFQQAAADVLQSAQAVMPRMSPEYQALFQTVTQALQGVQAFAEAQPDADVLQQQLDALQTANTTIRQAAEDQIAALEAQKADVIAKADEQIAVARDALRRQVDAINEAADRETDRINAGVADALEENARQQATLLGKQIGQQETMLGMVTSQTSSLSTIATITRENAGHLIDLGSILAQGFHSTVAAIVSATVGSGGTTLPVIGTRQFGGPIPRTGAYLLHSGEYVQPKGGGREPVTVNVTFNGRVDDYDEVERRVQKAVTRAIRRGEDGL